MKKTFSIKFMHQDFPANATFLQKYCFVLPSNFHDNTHIKLKFEFMHDLVCFRSNAIFLRYCCIQQDACAANLVIKMSL